MLDSRASEPDTVSKSPTISLESISRDQASVLQNLFELYVYDFSEQLPLDLEPSGLRDVASFRGETNHRLQALERLAHQRPLDGSGTAPN
jgi:hypothetical protein